MLRRVDTTVDTISDAVVEKVDVELYVAIILAPSGWVVKVGSAMRFMASHIPTIVLQQNKKIIYLFI